MFVYRMKDVYHPLGPEMNHGAELLVVSTRNSGAESGNTELFRNPSGLHRSTGVLLGSPKWGGKHQAGDTWDLRGVLLSTTSRARCVSFQSGNKKVAFFFWIWGILQVNYLNIEPENMQRTRRGFKNGINISFHM